METNNRWQIKIEEISAGVYQFLAKDEDGRTVDLSGTDPEALQKKGQESIKQIDAEVEKTKAKAVIGLHP